MPEIAPGVVVPDDAINFVYSSSGGPGGQNVNKRATKAELRLELRAVSIPADARDRLARLLGRRLTDEGVIVISAEEHRSQPRNRAACLDRLRDLVVRALVRPKSRRATRPSRGSVERRLREKQQRGAAKRRRRERED